MEGKTKSMLILGIAIVLLGSVMIPSMAIQVKQTNGTVSKTMKSDKLEYNNEEDLADRVKDFLAKDEIYVDEGLETLKYFKYKLEKEIEKESDFREKLELISLLNNVKTEIAWLEDMKNLSSEQATPVCKDNFDFTATQNKIKDNISAVVTRNKIGELKSVEVEKTSINNRDLNTGPDLEANEVYLSYEKEDWEKEHVATDPQAGDKLYIHWVYTIYGSGTVDPFHIRIKLYTENGEKVIDWEYRPDKDYREGHGSPYKFCFTSPWVAPGGYDYVLSEIVDSKDEIDENNENNNIVSTSFTVSGKHFDVEAKDVYLSYEKGDWDKNHVTNTPDAGDELYIHFKYTIWGIPEKKVDSFHRRVMLVTYDDDVVINFTDEVTKDDNLKAGYTYRAYLVTEEGDGWVAPGGDYALAGVVDTTDKISEWDENNNMADMIFSVTPRDENFDMRAADVWLSTEQEDWNKQHQPDFPVEPNTEVFFYFEWSISGIHGTKTSAYDVKMRLEGPGGFEYEDVVEKDDWREAGTTVRIFLSDEEGNGWPAVPGDYTLTCTVDSQDDVKEWAENNNEKTYNFKVKGGNNVITEDKFDSRYEHIDTWKKRKPKICIPFLGCTYFFAGDAEIDAKYVDSNKKIAKIGIHGNSWQPWPCLGEAEETLQMGSNPVKLNQNGKWRISVNFDKMKFDGFAQAVNEYDACWANFKLYIIILNKKGEIINKKQINLDNNPHNPPEFKAFEFGEEPAEYDLDRLENMDLIEIDDGTISKTFDLDSGEYSLGFQAVISGHSWGQSNLQKGIYSSWLAHFCKTKKSTGDYYGLFKVNSVKAEYISTCSESCPTTDKIVPSINGPKFIDIYADGKYILSATTASNIGQVYYKVDWGDATNDTYGPVDCDEEIIVSHSWDSPGRKRIEVEIERNNGIEESCLLNPFYVKVEGGVPTFSNSLIVKNPKRKIKRGENEEITWISKSDDNKVMIFLYNCDKNKYKYVTSEPIKNNGSYIWNVEYNLDTENNTYRIIVVTYSDEINKISNIHYGYSSSLSIVSDDKSVNPMCFSFFQNSRSKCTLLPQELFNWLYKIHFSTNRETNINS